jgi:hypothetical protein
MAETGLEILRQELARKRTEAMALEQAIAVLEGGAVLISGINGSTPSGNKSYEGLGIADAAARFIKEIGKPVGTREIADALLSRGLQTKSKNYVATVYATLDNSKQIIRTPEGNWTVKEEST